MSGLPAKSSYKELAIACLRMIGAVEAHKKIGLSRMVCFSS